MNDLLNYINVVMYDGNRKVNWDFRDRTPLADALEKFGFTWRKDSIRVNGHAVAENMLHHDLSRFFAEAKKADESCGRLFVTMKKPEKLQKKETA